MFFHQEPKENQHDDALRCDCVWHNKQLDYW